MTGIARSDRGAAIPFSMAQASGDCFVPRNDTRIIVIARRGSDVAIPFSLAQASGDCFVPRNDTRIVVVARSGSDVAISFSMAQASGDYKLHPCNLPFGPHFVRSILIQQN